MLSPSLAVFSSIHKPATFIYKTDNGLSITLDVYSDYDARSKPSRPALVFYHGGGLVTLNRKAVSPYLIQSALSRGWVLISVDYRLLPQVDGLEILADITAAWAFICTKLASSKSGYNLDLNKLIVGGASAGGYLAYQSGVHFQPRPVAVMSIYGVSSFNHPFARQDQLSIEAPSLSKIDVQPFLDEPPSTGETPDAVDPLLPDHHGKGGIDFDESQSGPRDRTALSMYFMQNSLYPKVIGTSKDVDPLKSMTRNFPPTVIIHGEKDRVVPIDVSLETTATLQNLGVPVKFISVPGKNHAFEHFAKASDTDGSKLWSTYLAQLFMFLDKAISHI